MKKLLLFLMLPLMFLPLALSGCASMQGTGTSASGLSSDNIKLETKMSSSIFLQPVAPSKKTVYISVRNTSTATGLNFSSTLKNELVKFGYRVVNNPSYANFIIMSNILYIGKTTQSNSFNGALLGGFGGALIGSRYNSTQSTIVGGGAGALIGGLLGALLQNQSYFMVVDIQLEQRSAGSFTTNYSNASQGIASNESTYNAGTRNWAIYRDRIVSKASSLNLNFASAETVIKKQIAHSIANLLP